MRYYWECMNEGSLNPKKVLKSFVNEERHEKVNEVVKFYENLLPICLDDTAKE